MSRLPRLRGRALVAAALATAVVATLQVGAAAVPAQDGAPTFKTQVGGTYDGMPLFDGEPSHLDAYLDALVSYAGIEAAANWANGIRGDFTIPSGPNAGKVVPGALMWGEGVQGVSTDFPAQISLGQSWNSGLLREVGGVIADENLNTEDYTGSWSAFNPNLAAALQDIRPNPLSGRIDESFGEDPEHAQALIDTMSRGATGIDAEGNDDGFWTKSVLTTKHYTTYAAQWFRITGNYDSSARSQMEYWTQPPNKGFESGAISSFLTTYGRTNGIPNSISPLVKYAQDKSPWGGMYTTPDNGAENRLHVANAYGNGYDDRYAPTWGDATALFAIADAGSIAATGASPDRNTELLQRAQNGTYGVSNDNIVAVAKTQMAPLVRTGIFNERDENGLPKDYPFTDLSAASDTPIDANVPEHQQTALQAARESIVLLKNDDALPLTKDSSLAVVGPLSDTRLRTTYSTSTPALENAGLTPVEGIEALSDGDVTTDTDGNLVRIKSVAADKYLTLGNEANPTLNATDTTGEDAATFEAFDWGQQAYSLQSTQTGKWLQYASNSVNVGQTFNLSGRGNGSGWGAPTSPNRLRPVDNEDGTVSFVVDSYSEGFSGGFETTYYTKGRYLTVDPATGTLGVTDVLKNEANATALRTDAAKFVVETTQETGSFATEADSDYAVVVVGQLPRNSQGEGSDRSDLALGTDQYELVERVADAHPGRTVVVLSTSTPVLAEAIQQNPKVAAIVQAPDGGQYGNLALAQVLFGDYAPTGRLSTTWYASMDALPKIDSYSIPDGENVTKTLDSLDPRFTVDMTNADPAETKLTYKYTDAETTYDFGYGLSYSTFDYSGLHVQQDGDTTTATVTIANTGDVTTEEVVQLYASNPASTYDDAAPTKKLVAFDKVTIPAGESKDVTLTFDTENLALWDVNTNAQVVEPGTYDFHVGDSSTSKAATKAPIEGDGLGTLDATAQPVNVFDHSFAASNVTYRETSKQNTVDGLNADKLVNGYSAVMSRDAGSWTALNDVVLDDAAKVTLSLASANAESSVELRLDSPDGPTVAQLAVGKTGASEYSIPGTTPAGDIPVKEAAFQDVTADLTQPVSGTHDVYIVFGQADIRVKDLQLTRAEPAGPAVDITVEPRCLAGKVSVAVRVLNQDSTPLDITVETPYGNKSFEDVVPGKNAYQAFTSRQASIPDGVVTVTATNEDVSSTAAVEYDGRSCG